MGPYVFCHYHDLGYHRSHEAVSTTFDETRETTTFTFESEFPKGDALLTIYYDGILNDKMAGFYRSSYKDAMGNAKVMGVTQFEATEARRAFPCWDEPAVKATFSIKLVVPVELEALSNMPVDMITQVEPEEKTIHFAKTPIMSTYVGQNSEQKRVKRYRPGDIFLFTCNFAHNICSASYLYISSWSLGLLVTLNMSSRQRRS